MTSTLIPVAAETRPQLSTILELRDVEISGRPYQYIEGRAVPFEEWATIGWFLEQHAAGAFRATTKGGNGKRAPLLLFHDNRSYPIGLPEKWAHDDGGLDGVWRLNDSAEAQRAAKHAEAGELSLSIGFTPLRSEWQRVDDWAPELGPEHMDRVTRLENRLVEVSLTPTPAFAGATISNVRSAERIETRDADARRDGWSPKRRAVDSWRELVDGLR